MSRLGSTNASKFNERKRFHILKKARSRWYTIETISDADYTDDLVLLINITGQAESLLPNLEQKARGIGLYVNSVKTQFMCFKMEPSPHCMMKLIDKVTYHGNNISSAESDLNIHIGKSWAAVYKVISHMKIWFPWENKMGFLPRCNSAVLLSLTKPLKKKLDGNYMLYAVLNKSWKQHPTQQQLYSHLLPISHIILVGRNKTCRALLEKQGRTLKQYSLHIDPPVWLGH